MRRARGKGIYDIVDFAGEPGTGSKPIGGKRSGTFSPWGDC